MVELSLSAADLLKKENLDACVINARFARPLDSELFLKISGEFNHIVTVEDGILNGGFGSSVLELVNRPVLRLGLPCEFIEHGKRNELLEKYGLDAKGIAKSITSFISKPALELKVKNGVYKS
jgi:1-deoxy-D-xylulose-5-phosphate synthase